MSLWKKIKKLLRQLAGKDLPKAVIEEPEEPPFEWVSPYKTQTKEQGHHPINRLL